jgi:hypothetical protein
MAMPIYRVSVEIQIYAVRDGEERREGGSADV